MVDEALKEVGIVSVRVCVVDDSDNCQVGFGLESISQEYLDMNVRRFIQQRPNESVEAIVSSVNAIAEESIIKAREFMKLDTIDEITAWIKANREWVYFKTTEEEEAA